MSRRPVAFVTCRALREGAPDDGLAAAACAERGVDVESVAWEDQAVEWAGYDALVVRSAWSYHRMPDRFDAWLDALAASRVRVFNPVETMRWNADKRYLLDLAEAGVPVIPTVRVDAAADLDGGAIERAVGGAEWVAKPAVGASAEGVLRARADRVEDLDRLGRSLDEGPILVQRYVPEVAERGEWSVVHLGGAYSHAVLKSPASGDFRVQEALGGTTRPGEPPASVRALAERALDAVDGECLYARIDAVETDAGPLLVELELIEPSLFFGHAPGSAERFADALAGALEAT